MSKDIFKAMGIQVTDDHPRLIDSGGFQIHSNGQGANQAEPLRKGIGFNASDMLEDQLNKGHAVFIASPGMGKKTRVSRHAEDIGPMEGKEIKDCAEADERFVKETTEDYSINLNGSHGENFHSDNDKMIADHQSRIHEADSQFGPEERPAKSTRKVNEWNPTYKDGADGEKDYTYRSLSREELFLKAMSMDFEVEKGKFKEMAIEEMEREEKEGKRKKNMRKLMDRVGKIGDKVQAEADSGMPRKTQTISGHQGSGPNKNSKYTKRTGSPGNYKYHYKSELDELTDLIKGKGKFDYDKDGDLDEHEQAHKTEDKKLKKIEADHKKMKACGYKKSFVKSAGPGGMVFDFGAMTGNPIADYATQLLNRHGDPTQQQTAQQQAVGFEKALGEYVKKGKDAYTSEQAEATEDGSVHKGWDLDTPMDQQVKAAYEKEQLDKSVETPAVKNDYNETTMNLDGDIIKATSETDAALIKEMQKQGIDLSGAFGKGEVIADARNGGAVSICAGDPLPQELTATEAE